MSNEKKSNGKKKQDDPTDEFKDALPVFVMKTINDTNSIKFKYIGWTKTPEKVSGELIEIETDTKMMNRIGKNSYFIGKFGQYDVFARFYMCHLIGDYLLTHDKIPIFYMTIIYERRFITGNLFNYFLYFTMTKESRKELKTPKNYINKVVFGKFSLELVDDTNFLSRVQSEYPECMEEYLMTQNDTLKKKDITSEESKQILKEIKEKKVSLINELHDVFKPVEILFKSRKYIIEKIMYNVCESLKPLIFTGLKIRDNDRFKDNEESYEFPDKALTVDEIKKKYFDEE
jgi:hypothetical protein